MLVVSNKEVCLESRNSDAITIETDDSFSFRIIVISIRGELLPELPIVHL